MKRKTKTILVGFALMLALAPLAFAQYSSPWYSVYQVQNLGTGSASITVQYFDDAGNEVTAAQKNFTNVSAGSSVTVVQYTDDPDLGTGEFSAVISSDQPVVAVANLQISPSTGGYNPGPPFASYSGADSGATEVTLPAIMYNYYGWYTEFYVMNVGSATATNVDITYYPGDQGASGVTDLDNTISQYQSAKFSQEDMTSLGDSSTERFIGSAVISSDQAVVVVVNQHAPSDYKLLTYNGFGSGATGLLAPNYMRGHYGYYATLAIGNPSLSTTANVTITYTADTTYSTPNPGATVVANHTIDPGKSLVRHDGPTATDAQSDLDDATAFDLFFGAVKIESDISVVAMVNIEAEASGAAQGGTYNAISADEATTKISIPIIMADYYDYYTSATIQNASGSAGTVYITYTSDGTYSTVKSTSKTYSHSIDANGSVNIYEGHAGGLSIGDINSDTLWESGGSRRFLGSAVVISTLPIVCFVNEELDVDGQDSMYTYNAFNVSP